VGEMAGPYLVEEDARGRRRAAAAAGGSRLATARPCISLAATARAERTGGERERNGMQRRVAGSQQKRDCCLPAAAVRPGF